MVDDTVQRVAWLPGDDLAGPRPSSSVMYRQLTIDGWSAREAGNLVARLQGLRTARQGWTVSEIDHLLFLRAMVDTGRLDS